MKTYILLATLACASLVCKEAQEVEAQTTDVPKEAPQAGTEAHDQKPSSDPIVTQAADGSVTIDRVDMDGKTLRVIHVTCNPQVGSFTVSTSTIPEAAIALAQEKDIKELEIVEVMAPYADVEKFLPEHMRQIPSPSSISPEVMPVVVPSLFQYRPFMVTHAMMAILLGYSSYYLWKTPAATKEERERDTEQTTGRIMSLALLIAGSFYFETLVH